MSVVTLVLFGQVDVRTFSAAQLDRAAVGFAFCHDRNSLQDRSLLIHCIIKGRRCKCRSSIDRLQSPPNARKNARKKSRKKLLPIRPIAMMVAVITTASMLS